jgi:hypothetical protein
MAFAKAKKRNGTRQAKELLKRLDGDEFLKRVQLTESEVKVLDRICSGKYVRNAAAIMGALRTRIEYAYVKPRQELAIDVKDVTESHDITDEEWEATSRLTHVVRGG